MIIGSNQYDIIILTSSENKKNNNLTYLLKKEFDFIFSIITKEKIYSYVSSFDLIKLKKEKSTINYKEFSLDKVKKDLDNISKKIIKTKKSYAATGLTIGLDYEKTTLSSKDNIKKLFPKIKINFKDCSKLFSELRLIKTNYEIENIRKACKISDKILCDIELNLKNKKFKTEKSIYNFIKIQSLKYDSKISFEPIVATNKNSNSPHHIASNAKITKGFLLIDMGNIYNNYCSDITRMFYIGNPSNNELNKYKELLIVQEKLVKLCTPGTIVKDLEKKSRELLKTDEKFFIHSLGHGVGIDIHERPFFNENIKLKEGMIITIEPGIYFKKYGLRIEDTILVSKNPKKLTNFKKNLIII